MAFYLESTKAPGLKFRIAKYDKATHRAQLVGDTGVPFERELTKDVLNKFGYRVVQVPPDNQSS